MARTLTAADTVIILTVPLVFPSGFQLQGFSTDDIYEAADIDIAETMMGVDGKLSAGFVPKEVAWTVTLQADSESNDNFEQWYASQQTNNAVYRASGIVSLEATTRKYNMKNGVMTRYSPMPKGGKVLQPRKYTITFESVLPAPI